FRRFEAFAGYERAAVGRGQGGTVRGARKRIRAKHGTASSRFSIETGAAVVEIEDLVRISGFGKALPGEDATRLARGFARRKPQGRQVMVNRYGPAHDIGRNDPLCDRLARNPSRHQMHQMKRALAMSGEQDRLRLGNGSDKGVK